MSIEVIKRTLDALERYSAESYALERHTLTTLRQALEQQTPHVASDDISQERVAKTEKTTMTFEERCKILQECLPDAPYRDALTALHNEMLQAIAEAGAEKLEPVAWMDEKYGRPIKPSQAKIKEKNT